MIARTLTHPIAGIVWGLPLVLIFYLVAISVAGVGAVGALAGLLIIGSLVEREPPARYGLDWHGAGWGLVVGVLVGAAVISVAVGLLALVGVYRFRIVSMRSRSEPGCSSTSRWRSARRSCSAGSP